MTKVKPFIECCDYWPVKIPPNALEAYKVMIREGQLSDIHVTYNRTVGSTLVSYLSNQPHEWVKDRLRKIVMFE